MWAKLESRWRHRSKLNGVDHKYTTRSGCLATRRSRLIACVLVCVAFLVLQLQARNHPLIVTTAPLKNSASDFLAYCLYHFQNRTPPDSPWISSGHVERAMSVLTLMMLDSGSCRCRES